MTKAEKPTFGEMLKHPSKGSNWRTYLLQLDKELCFIIAPPGANVEVTDNKRTIVIFASRQAAQDSHHGKSTPTLSHYYREPTLEDYIADPSLCVF